MKLISRNIRPISLVLLCGVIGYFFGALATGIMVGVGIIAVANLFF